MEMLLGQWELLLRATINSMLCRCLKLSQYEYHAFFQVLSIRENLVYQKAVSCFYDMMMRPTKKNITFLACFVQINATCSDRIAICCFSGIFDIVRH